MDELIRLIVDNGIGVICVAYLIYFQNTTMKDMTKALNSITTELTIIKEKISGENHG